jgi:hypothetical protein
MQQVMTINNHHQGGFSAHQVEDVILFIFKLSKLIVVEIFDLAGPLFVLHQNV